MAGAEMFRRRVREFVDRTLSPEAQSRALAVRARRELAGQIAAGRGSKSYRTFVDGREGVSEDVVAPAPHGQIVYRFNHLGAVVTFALSFLVNRSPMRSGTYRRSFYIGVSTSGSMVPTPTAPTRGEQGRFAPSAAPERPAGGKFIPMERFNADALTADVTEIVIGNTQPYSRGLHVRPSGAQTQTLSIA